MFGIQSIQSRIDKAYKELGRDLTANELRDIYDKYIFDRCTWETDEGGQSTEDYFFASKEDREKGLETCMVIEFDVQKFGYETEAYRHTEISGIEYMAGDGHEEYDINQVYCTKLDEEGNDVECPQPSTAKELNDKYFNQY